MEVITVALTMKQERFCENIVKGLNGIDSYMDAYDCKSRHAANVESTKLLKRDDITERIKELNKPILNIVQNTAISARQKQIDFIQSRIDHCLAVNDEQSIIRYTDMLSKIHGLYKDSEQPQQTENNISNMTNETLLKLVE